MTESQLKQVIEFAHQAGQRNAGIDASPKAAKDYYKSLVQDGVLSFVSDLLREDEIRETFYSGFDEGYTNPLERDGRIITEEEYQAERKRNYFQWLNNVRG